MGKGFKAAVVQMLVESGRPEANLARAERRIAAAAGAGARLAVLPETADAGWMDGSTRELAGAIPDGRWCRALRDAARAHGLYVCCGLAERAGERVYNSAVLIDPRGEVLLVHRKLNELEIAQDVYDQGDRLGVCQTELGTLGVAICADGFARHEAITRTLGYMGAEVVLAPSAWAVPADHDQGRTPYGGVWRSCFGPVARDFAMWIVATSNVGRVGHGPWAGRPCIGCSMVFGPDGRQVLEGPYGAEAEEMLYVEIAPVARPARGHGWEAWWKRRRQAGAKD